MAEQKIVVLHDGSQESVALIERLKEAQFSVELCRSPEELHETARQAAPHLFVISSELSDPKIMQIAEEIYDSFGLPSILILNSAGDNTQASFRKHPAVIGMHYKPLNVDKILERIVKFFSGPADAGNS